MTMQDCPSALSEDKRRSLQCLAETMIPASEEYGVPGAGDDVIFADILRSFGRDAEHIAAVLRLLDDLSRAVFADLTPLQRDAVASQLREAGGQSLMYLSQIILQCYYRDDRVMRSLDMELRPPFPKGFEVDQGDWSMLDPVRARPKLYREVP
jgi:hypothetical protein